MNDIDIAYFILLAVAVTCSYWTGKKDGISVTLDFMRDNGHIDFDD